MDLSLSTGHNTRRRYLHIIGIILCNKYEEGEETPAHVLCKCEVLIKPSAHVFCKCEVLIKPSANVLCKCEVLIKPSAHVFCKCEVLIKPSANVLCKCEVLIKLRHYYMAFLFAPEDIVHLNLGHSGTLFTGQDNHESRM